MEQLFTFFILFYSNISEYPNRLLFFFIQMHYGIFPVSITLKTGAHIQRNKHRIKKKRLERYMMLRGQKVIKRTSCTRNQKFNN